MTSSERFVHALFSSTCCPLTVYMFPWQQTIHAHRQTTNNPLYWTNKDIGEWLKSIGLAVHTNTLPLHYSVSVCLFLFLSLSVCLPSFISLSLCLSLSVSVCLFVCLSVCLSVRLSVRPSVCLSVCLSLSLSLSLFLCLSLSFSVSLSLSLSFSVSLSLSLFLCIFVSLYQTFLITCCVMLLLWRCYCLELLTSVSITSSSDNKLIYTRGCSGQAQLDTQTHKHICHLHSHLTILPPNSNVQSCSHFTHTHSHTCTHLCSTLEYRNTLITSLEVEFTVHCCFWRGASVRVNN